jgi:transposase
VEKSKIQLPKFSWIKVKMHRDIFQGEMKTLTVSRTSTGKYYISILTDDGEKCPEPETFSHATMIGVDVGLLTFATLSTGVEMKSTTGEVLLHPTTKACGFSRPLRSNFHKTYN